MVTKLNGELLLGILVKSDGKMPNMLINVIVPSQLAVQLMKTKIVACSFQLSTAQGHVQDKTRLLDYH